MRSSKDHYESLGGESKLDISLRHFQQIESGKYPPSEKLLVSLFLESPPAARKTLIIAFFESVLRGNPRARGILDYLSGYLLPEENGAQENIWESDRKRMLYSEEQLDFLVENPDALRFHKRVMLYEGLPPGDREGISAEKLGRLVDLELVHLDENRIKPSRNLYRIPSFSTAGPRLVAKGSEYIRRHLDLFLSREGHENQVLAQAMQLVTPAMARTIHQHMEAFKSWVQSTAASGTEDTLVPLLFVGFTKVLSPREL